MNRKIIKALVALVDFALLNVALLLVLTFRYGFDGLGSQWLRHFPVFGLIGLLWLLDFYIADIYNITQKLDYRRFLVCMAINVGLAIAIFYLLSGIPIAPKTNLGLITALYVVFFLAWRILLERFMNQYGIRRPVVFIGLDTYSLKLAEKLAGNPRLGYAIDGFVIGAAARTPETLPAWLGAGPIKLMNTMEELSVFLEERSIHSLVVSEEWYHEVHQQLYRFFPTGVRMFQLSTFWELVEETIPVHAADELWFLQNLSRGPYSVYHKLKRFFDLLTSVLFLPLILLFCMLTFLLVRATSKGPAIYRQTRVGLGNRNFTIYKFRSMRLDAETNGAVWASEKDPRLTPVGEFIRRYRLDELPQIFNVLKGDMSIIGPRPERPEFVDKLAHDIPHYNLRHLVKPGLTGWAQVKYRYGASVEDSEVKLMYDLFYVKNVSSMLDLKIALKTILTVISKGGR
ncbi:MAG: sugar transferase [Spirochaetales bacterium]|nr:MAG: sugar transferase [Spirochaetales bacterium]